MPVTASGPLAIPFRGLAVLVAASATFRTVVDVDTAAEALDFIFYPGLDRKANPNKKRPWALITPGQAWSMDNRNVQSGQLELTFEFPTTYDDLGEGLLDFANKAGAIIAEMFALANTSGEGGTVHYWNMVSVSLSTPPKAWTEEDEPDEREDKFFEVGFWVNWF